MTDYCNKERQRSKTLSLCDGDRRHVEIGLHQCIWDLGAKVDETYYCDLLLSQQLLPAIRHVSSEFIF